MCRYAAINRKESGADPQCDVIVPNVLDRVLAFTDERVVQMFTLFPITFGAG